MSEIKVFWADFPKNPIQYDGSKHSKEVYKFVHWEKGKGGVAVIIAGDLFHDHLVLKEFGVMAGLVSDDNIPDGAGTLEESINSIAWWSVTLGVRTPKELRKPILDALGLSHLNV